MSTSEQTGCRHWSVRSPADLGRTIAGVRGEREMTQERALRRLGATLTVTMPEDDGDD